MSIKYGTMSFFTFLATSIFLTNSALSENWGHYVDKRFGTQADFPLLGFTATPADTDSHGQSWVSSDGMSELSVFGALMLESDGFKKYSVNQMAEAEKNGVDITYQVIRKKWFVYSGFRGENIVYAKATLNTKCTPFVVNNLYIEFPKVQKPRFEGIVLRMEKTMKSGKGTQCG